MTFLLIPLIYIAFSASMSAVLPPVDNKAVSPPAVEQPTSTPEEKQ